MPGPVKGGDGAKGGDGIGSAGRGGSQPGPGAPALRGGGSANAAGVNGSTRIYRSAGNGGNGADGQGRGNRGTKGSQAFLAGAINRVDETPNFQDGANGTGCLYSLTFTVRTDPTNVESVLRLAAPNARPLALVLKEGANVTVAVLIAREGTACLVAPGETENVQCGSGTASGTSPNGASFSASGSFSTSTGTGFASGSMGVSGSFEPSLEEQAWIVFMVLVTGTAQYDAKARLTGPFSGPP